MTLKSTQENQVIYRVSNQVHIFNSHGSQFWLAILYARNSTQSKDGIKKCMGVALGCCNA